jgi:hypothetical protein
MVCVKQLTAIQVHALKTRELGLDADALDLETQEAIAGALRRAAGSLCPCSAATLIRNVLGPLRGLVPDLKLARELVEETLEAMTSHGDMLEQSDLRDGSSPSRLLLYAAPASFVVRQSGLVLLLGIAADQISPLPPDLEHRIQYVGHIRRLLPSKPHEDLRGELRHLGLIELSPDAWLRRPRVGTESQFLAAIDRTLDEVPSSRDIPGLLLLDPEMPVRYYRGRWTEPTSQTGRFVGRRKQAYGADLWCYVQLNNGQPERMIDFPRLGSRWRGCDEAWHVQMAIDARRGVPQRFRITPSEDAVVLQLFSPVPAWARRRWDAIGEPVPSTGTLFAYRIPKTEFDEERLFLREALWLEAATSSLK